MDTKKQIVIERPVSPNFYTQWNSPRCRDYDSDCIKIKSVVQTEKYTRIDLQIFADTKTYNSRWWCNIHKSTYLRVKNIGVYAVNNNVSKSAIRNVSFSANKDVLFC